MDARERRGETPAIIEAASEKSSGILEIKAATQVV
jgi:hypothetical protein